MKQLPARGLLGSGALPASSTRRQFLCKLSGGALVLVGAGLAGCAGGSGSPDGGGGGGGSGLMTADDVVAAFAAVRGYAASLTPTSDEGLRESLLTFIRNRPEFIGAGATEDGVWGTLLNGGTYVVVTNRVPVPGEADANAAAVALAAGTDVPAGSVVARLVNAMGAGFVNEATAIQPAVAKLGYSIGPSGATLEALTNLGSPAFFYLSAHGTTGDIPVLDSSGKMVKDSAGEVVMVSDYGVSTTTEATKDAIAARMGDFEAGLLLAGTVYEDTVGGKAVYKDRFMVTSRWVTKNWRFAKNSLVWISACSSTSAGAAPFRSACIAKGAGLYVGWTDTTAGPDAAAASKFVVDRLLGANVLAPKESPAQRSFPYDQVWTELRGRGLDQSKVRSQVTSAIIPGRVALLQYTPGPGTTFGLLAPSIHHLLIDEYAGELHLMGSFGTPPANERAVLVDGLEMTARTWEATQIVCPIPRSGQGSKGEVKVSVRGHDSNVRRITSWDLSVDFEYADQTRPGLKLTGPYLLHFRGDIGEYRDAPGQAPIKPVRCFAATADSLASLTASGSHTEDHCTTTWEGAADYTAVNWQGGQTGLIVIAVLKVDTTAKTGALGLALGGMQPAVYTMTEVCPDSPPVVGNFAAFQSILEGAEEFTIDLPDDEQTIPTLPAMRFSYTDTFGIPAHKFIDVALDTLTMQWPAAPATYPPDAAAARGVL